MIQFQLMERLIFFFPQQHLGVKEYFAFGRRVGSLRAIDTCTTLFSNQPETFEFSPSTVASLTSAIVTLSLIHGAQAYRFQA